MTIDKFMENFKYRSRKTVLSWLDNEFIPGAKKNTETGIWYIPEDARLPYTQTRAKGGQAIYISIVRGSLKGKNVFPKLFKMTPQRFEVYIEELKQANLITSYEAEGITYYEPTLIALQYSLLSRYRFEQFILKALEATAKGVHSANLDHI